MYPHPHHLIIFDQQPRFVARLHFNRVQVEGAIHQLRLLQSQADAMRYHLNLRHHLVVGQFWVIRFVLWLVWHEVLVLELALLNLHTVNPRHT